MVNSYTSNLLFLQASIVLDDGQNENTCSQYNIKKLEPNNQLIRSQLTTTCLNINTTPHSDRAGNSILLQRFFESICTLAGCGLALIPLSWIERNGIDMAQ